MKFFATALIWAAVGAAATGGAATGAALFALAAARKGVIGARAAWARLTAAEGSRMTTSRRRSSHSGGTLPFSTLFSRMGSAVLLGRKIRTCASDVDGNVELTASA